jgi:hypothetical protein
MENKIMDSNPEQDRVSNKAFNNPWKLWGPYLTERQWGTVREDYSANGSAWEYVSHDAARSKAYRWGEEGIGGISDNKSIMCFAVALWNHKDNILKERLFGLTGNEGNHGEDVKEQYYYLDSAPTHTYMKMLYKYPQQEFPYQKLATENRNRTRKDPEYEIIDTGIFDKDEYFDVFIEYAKADPKDILIKITINNRGNNKAPLTLLPTLWFRNTWSWGYNSYKPELYKTNDDNSLKITHTSFGQGNLYSETNSELLFCENETNFKKLYGSKTEQGFTKDGINDYVVDNIKNAINAQQSGTKASFLIQTTFEPQQEQTFRFRLTQGNIEKPFEKFDEIFNQRVNENNIFYNSIQHSGLSEDLKAIQRQAFAGMMWSKQYYYFNINEWLDGDPSQPKPIENRANGRNKNWRHLNNSNIISMPDKWEYPWYAAWDLAFHCVPIARIDPSFAKRQLVIMVREYYMHPNGQIPAYEWNFSDVNPPVHAWATWKVYEIDKKRTGKGDLDFLERIFHKLLMNFTWWVNRKDEEGNNIFEGGFLGLDNIGVFDRSQPLPTGGYIEQSDGTSWMAMYALNMLRISKELALGQPIYQDSSSKFFEHFIFIADATVNIGKKDLALWDAEDKFYYDVLKLPDGENSRIKIKSMVGLIPLFAVECFSMELLNKLPDFKRRLEYSLHNRPDFAKLVFRWNDENESGRMLSLLRGDSLEAVLGRMLDENEFLSPYGIRALSKYHLDHPYTFDLNDTIYSVKYLPGESESGLFGGNSNWRGPVWFPVNYMIIESLRKFHEFYGDKLTVDFPTGSGNKMNLKQIAQELSKRLIKIFAKDKQGNRAVYGTVKKLQEDPHYKDYILFYEYFNGDNGAGLGASHQTGWTGLVADLIYDLANENTLDDLSFLEN